MLRISLVNSKKSLKLNPLVFLESPPKLDRKDIVRFGSLHLGLTIGVEGIPET
jgi:hypothetical protein